MAKKGKGNKAKQRRAKKLQAQQAATARKHDENKTIRYRLKKELIRVDRNNKPIPVDRRKIAEAMLEQGGTPPEAAITPDIPDNVVSLCARRAAGPATPLVPKDTRGSSEPSEQSLAHKELVAEVRQRINYDRVLFASWSNERGGSNAATWGRKNVGDNEMFAMELRRLSEYKASHPGGKNPAPSTEEAQEQTAVSMMHNPGIKAKPIEHGGYAPKAARTLDRKFWDMSAKPAGKTPSGRLIREFTEGKYAPPKSEETPVVYTTPTRDWGKAANDESHTVTTNMWSAEDQLRMMINTVDRIHWPRQLDKFLFESDGKWHIHTGLVRQAVKDSEDRVIHAGVALALMQHTKDSDEELLALTTENNMLSQELKFVEHELAITLHDDSSAEEIKKELYGTAIAKPPKDAGQLLSEFKVFKQLLEADNGGGALMAFSRYVYPNTNVHEIIKEEADHVCAERQRAFQDRLRMLRLKKFFRQVPAMLEINKLRNMANRARTKATLAGEVQALRNMRRTAAKRAAESCSIYYSRLNIAVSSPDFKVTVNGRDKTHGSVEMRCINRRVNPTEWSNRPKVGLRKLDSVRAIHKAVGFKEFREDEYYENKRDMMAEWWARHASDCETRYLANTTSGKLLVGVTKAARAINKVLQTNVDPWSRKKEREAEVEKLRIKTARVQRRKDKQHRKHLCRAQAAAEKAALEQANKEKLAKEAEARAIREAAKRAYRNAH